MEEKLNKILVQLGINSKEEYLKKAFSRNIGILSEKDMEILAKSRVAIPGMGGVGGIHLVTLTRLGIGKFNIADFDKFDIVNINRQYGAKVSNFNKPKIYCMAKEAKDINPYLEISLFEKGLNLDILDDFLNDVDVVVDGLDFFEFDIRRELFNRAREKGIYVVTAAPLGFGSALLVFAPDSGMSFDEYFDVYEGMPEIEKYLNFGLGLAPKGLHIKYIDKSKIDLKAQRGPSSIVACNICAAMAGVEVIKILLNRGKVRPVPFYIQFDPYCGKFVKGKLRKGNKNYLQRMKKLLVQRFILKLNLYENPLKLPEILNDKEVELFSDKVVNYLLKAGIMAPSGDNAQPWKFSIKNKKIYVYLDSKRDQSFFNIDQIASIISCGAVIENIKLAASALKIKPNLILMPEKDNAELMGILDFEKIEKTHKDPLCDFIWLRHTNRKFYEKTKIDHSILNRIKEQGEQIEGTKVRLITDPKKIKQVGKLVYNVDKIRVEFRPLHEHLIKMIRFNHREMYSTRDGFPLKNLEAGIQGEIFLRITKPWPIMHLFNKLGIGKLVAFHSFRSIKSASGVGLITVSGEDRIAYLRGGMAMQRVWLETVRNNLSFQPMTAITLFWERWKRNKDSFLQRHKELLNKIWSEYERIFELDLNSNESHIMLFRFGYAKGEVRVRTLRRHLSEFIVSGKIIAEKVSNNTS